MTHTKKLPSWLATLILTGLGLSVSPHQILTRTDEVSRVLSPVLSRYEVIRMAPGAIEQQVRTTGELRLRFRETDLYFNLEPHDMRAPNYRAVETGPGGVRRTLPPQTVHTFKGKLVGREDTQGRFNLTGGGVEGVVYAPEGWVYVEPLQNYLPSAPAGALVVYGQEDIKSGEDLQCGESLPQRLQRGVNRVAVQSEATIPTNYKYIVDVATEADYEYVQALGGSKNANREIEGILNQVDGVYQSELSLQLRIVFQHAWATEENPYAEVEEAHLELWSKFRDYWEATFAAELNYDLAHLWTGKKIDGVIGLAGGDVCANTFGPDRGYAFTVHLTHPPVKYTITAHEIGHNFGAIHPDRVQGCRDTIMTHSSPGFTFCEFSRQEIATHVARYNSCLAPQPITLQPPMRLTAVAISNDNHASPDYETTLTWQDNSANESGFIVERRLDAEHERPRWDVPNWVSIATTPANVTIFTDTGLSPATGYHYRVRAVNGTESSIFSNAVLAGTPGIQPPTELRASAISNVDDYAFSNFKIVLDWGDNSYNDTGFIVQRRLDDSPDWASIAFTAPTSYYSDRGLRPATGYHYRMRAVNGTESSAFSNEYRRKTRGTQPPTELTATVVSDSRINLNWQDNSPNEKNFIVQRRLDGSLDWDTIKYSHANITEISDGGLSPATTYHYRVWAANNNSEPSDFSNEVRATTLATRTPLGGTHPPMPPSQLTATVVSSSVIHLAWNDNSTNERGFSAERRLDSFSDWVSIGSVPANVPFLTDVGLSPATTYHYRVRAVTNTNHSDFSNEVKVITGQWGITPPTELSATAYDDSRIHLNWEDNSSEETGYLVQRRLDGSPDWVSVITTNVSHVFGTKFTDVGLSPATTYHYRVRAVNDTDFSEFSNEVRVTTLSTLPPTKKGIHPPTEMAATAVSNSIIHLSWLDNSTRETGYLVQRRLDRLSDWVSIARTDANVSVFADTGLRPATTYHYRVRTFSDTESSDFSNEVMAATRGASPSTEGIEPLLSLYATAYDKSRIWLNWFYSNDTQTGFIVERRLEGSHDWVSVMILAANVTEITDAGLRPATTYHYRVRAFNDTNFSEFSPEASATTLGISPSTDGIGPPTGLRATPVSIYRIDLNWQDNSINEKGFRILRRLDGTGDWIAVGTTAANATTFSDEGLLPSTIYHYRVQAFNDTSSAFSNKARAMALGPPPTLIRFNPTSGPVGTRVTLTGTHFLGATAVAFNGVTATEFEVVSGTSIEAMVPPDASSGPISVVTSGGTAVSDDPFTVTTGILSRLFVPIVLRAQGRTLGSFFTSELTLTNRGTTTAIINYTYSAAIGTGSDTAVDSLEPGRQRVIPDAIAYLTALGIPIGSGSSGGTLVVDFSNLSSPSDAAVTVRVSTPVEEGRAGLAFPGLNPDDLLTGPVFITGLRQNSQDRSNVALQNAARDGDGNLTLRVTVFSGSSTAPGRNVVLPDLTLAPGGFHQYNGILKEAGFDNGYVKVERVSGAAPFYAYGVINDNFNSDGSFVFPVREDSLVGKRGQTLPVIIETGAFTSELVLTNFSALDKSVRFLFGADPAEAGGGPDSIIAFNLKAGEQGTWPNLVESLRQHGVPGIGPAGQPFSRTLFAIGTGPPITGGVTFNGAGGDMSGIVIGARTGSPDKRGGQYSLFYNGVPYGSASVETAWIYGLQQNAENRSNLALVNTGEVDDSTSTFEITIYDGSGETRPKTKSVTLGPRYWTQKNGILGNIRQGYVQVRKVSGNNPFVAYGVINDGGQPGERSGDGAFLPGQ